MPLVSYLCQIPCWALRIHMGMRLRWRKTAQGLCPTDMQQKAVKRILYVCSNSTASIGGHAGC